MLTKFAVAMGAALLLTGAPGTAFSQPSPSLADSTNFVTRHPAASISVVGTTLTLAFFPLDRAIIHRVREPDLQHSATLRGAASAFNVVGGVGFVVAGGTMLGVGYATHQNTVTQLGIRTTEAMVLNAIVNSTLKGLFGRQRPFVNETTPNVFGFGKGFASAGRTSFPSGHTSSSFAFATATAMVLRARAPGVARYVTPAAFGAATLVGAARVFGAHHWPSDVAAGATVGTLSGWLVTRREVDVGLTSVRWRF